jgi:hypothetical protein
VGLKLKSIALNLPFGLGGVNVEVSEAEVRAAWELYVELATRITAQSLEAGSGSAKEALDSIYTLFATTRSVLRAAGPDVGDSPNALGPLAIRILNEGIRPFLVKWHTETLRSGDVPAERRAAFDAELADMRTGLAEYVTMLGDIAGVNP